MTDTQFTTAPCRLAFPQLFVPAPKHKSQPDKLVYSATLLIPPSVSLDPFKKAIISAMNEDWGAPKKLFGRGNPLKSITELNAARAAKDQKPWQGYENGWHCVRVSSQYRPEVVDQAVQSVFNPPPSANGDELKRLVALAEARVYAGSWCHFMVGTFCWTDSGDHGVGFNVNAVQLVRDDTRLDGRKRATDVFQPIATGDKGPQDFDDVESADDIFG